MTPCEERKLYRRSQTEWRAYKDREFEAELARGNHQYFLILLIGIGIFGMLSLGLFA